MAGRVKDARLDSREARKKLAIRHQPYFRSLAEGLHLGYRKRAGATTWVMRIYRRGSYLVSSIGSADDNVDADGVSYLTWWQACDKARDLATGTSGDRHGAGKKAGYTVKHACDEYLANAEAEGQKSLRSSRNAINEHVLPAFGGTLIAHLTAHEIKTWRNRLATTPPRLRSRKDQNQKFAAVDMSDPNVQRQRQATANRVLTALKAVLNQAFREDRVDSDKAWRKVKPFKAVDAARERYATPQEVVRIANAARADFRQMVLAGIFSGARYGELCRLEVRDFIAATGKLHIRISKSNKERFVALTDEAQAFFKNHTAGRASAEIMLRHSGGGTWGPSHQSRPMRDACIAAKVIPPLGFHQLRHSYASHAVTSGMPLLVVAEALGHANTKMIEKFYAHMRQEYVDAQMREHAPKLGIAEAGNVAAIR